MKKHLVVIIDNNKKIEPKLYTCTTAEKTKEEAVQAAKTTYENKYKNLDYSSYYFID